MIYYTLLSIGVAYLLYMIVMQAITNLKREKAIEELREKWQNALIDEKQTKEEIMERIKKEYGESVANSIEKGVYKAGMPHYLVKMAVGRPRDIQKTEFLNSTSERWFYKSLILNFQNGKLIGWETNDNTQRA